MTYTGSVILRLSKGRFVYSTGVPCEHSGCDCEARYEVFCFAMGEPTMRLCTTHRNAWALSGLGVAIWEIGDDPILWERADPPPPPPIRLYRRRTDGLAP